jgi:hypothetical protein
MEPSGEMTADAVSQDLIAPECAGLMPAALGVGKRVEINGDQETCFIGTSDDLVGNVALGHYPFAAGRGFTQATWTVYPTAGSETFPAPLGSFDGRCMWPGCASSFPVQSQPQGFTGFSFDIDTREARLVSASHTGAQTGSVFLSDRNGTAQVAVAPAGGTSVAHGFNDVPGHSVVMFRRFDKHGVEVVSERPIHSGSIGPNGPLLPETVAVDLAGNTLVIITTSGAPANPDRQGRWIAPSGAALTPWFAVTTRNSIDRVQFLLDGSLVFREGSEGWTQRFRAGHVGSIPAPPFLVTRPHAEVAVARGGKAYVTMRAPDDPARIEVISAQGHICGAFYPPGGKSFPGFGLAVGRDGTLIQQAPANDAQTAQGGACSFRYWPQLLK